ncbi:MAG: Small GTP-binding domain protein [Promethearchaeota archaeon]|nr:MAG: Small GTP-binding domain protein [Candidatus Lokiarchaeota archaeon]
MKKKVVLKILITGDSQVGKTTLLYRYIEDEFIDTTTMTVGVEFNYKELQFDNTITQLQLWDVGGQERFRFMVDKYIKGADGALLLFDTTSMKSFVNVKRWEDLLRKENSDLPIVLVGTKADLDEFSVVQDYYPKLTAKKLEMVDYLKTSSKLGLKVDDAFEILCKEILDNKGYEI